MDEYAERDRGEYGDGTASYPGDPGREHEQPSPPTAPRCQYCGEDCSNGRSWDGGDLYACPLCAETRALVNADPS